MQEVFVKICGITNLADALHCVECGADALGFNFFTRSERYIRPEEACVIVGQLPRHITKFGVFVNARRTRIERIVGEVKLSALQLHGNEHPEDCSNFDVSVIKVLRVGPSFEPTDLLRYQVDAYLLDTQVAGYYGGSGHSFDWNVAVAAKRYGKIILSGGLNLSNVEAALRFVRPYGVDVCSGIESKPGKKDLNMVRDFIAKAKAFVYR